MQSKWRNPNVPAIFYAHGEAVADHTTSSELVIREAEEIVMLYNAIHGVREQERGYQRLIELRRRWQDPLWRRTWGAADMPE